MPKPVRIDGVRYPSLAAAAVSLGVTRQALSQRLAAGKIEPDGAGSLGRPPTPAGDLARGRDGRPEGIRVTGIPVGVLERVDGYVRRKGLRSRSRFLGECAREGFEARLAKERNDAA